MRCFEKRLITAISFAALLGLSACVTSGPPKASLTAVDAGYFSIPTSVRWQGRVLNIGGTLTFPEGAGSVVPLVILVHSSDGIDYSEKRWESMYLSRGIAVFMLDYFAPRGVSGSSRNVPYSGMDVYDAIKVLATHPRIDKNKIAVQGFSIGSTVTMSAASVLKDRNDVPKPRAYILTYGGCENAQHMYGLEGFRGTSFLFLIGEEDKASYADVCPRVADTFSQKGVDAKAILFPGVYHAFDDMDTRSITFRKRRIVMKPNEDATQKSFEESTALLARVFK